MTMFKPLAFTYRSRRSKRIAAPRAKIRISCSKLSDSEEDAKVESTRVALQFGPLTYQPIECALFLPIKVRCDRVFAI